MQITPQVTFDLDPSRFVAALHRGIERSVRRKLFILLKLQLIVIKLNSDWIFPGLSELKLVSSVILIYIAFGTLKVIEISATEQFFGRCMLPRNSFALHFEIHLKNTKKKLLTKTTCLFLQIFLYHANAYVCVHFVYHVRSLPWRYKRWEVVVWGALRKLSFFSGLAAAGGSRGLHFEMTFEINFRCRRRLRGPCRRRSIGTLAR